MYYFISTILSHSRPPCFFFFNDTATTEIYTLSLHDALPISLRVGHRLPFDAGLGVVLREPFHRDRKSTRLNSSQGSISYAVFSLKKKKDRRHDIGNELNRIIEIATTHYPEHI